MGLPLTSDFDEPAENSGGRAVSRNLVHSKPSLSPNTRRRSVMERLRTAFGIIAISLRRNAAGNVTRHTSG